jgi:hypothetical protein
MPSSTRRSHRVQPGRRVNPLREIAAGQRRALEVGRDRERAERLTHQLPSLIEDRVGEHIQKLESKLLKDFQQIGRKAMDESAALLNEQLGDRIATLEQISSIQSRTITNLRDSSKAADHKVASVVTSIEQTLSGAVPGFRLEAPKYAQPQLEQSAVAHERVEDDGEDRGESGFCPKCTSTNIRRANRHGLWEEVLRLFFLAPYRCRACRHKFYRF